MRGDFAADPRPGGCKQGMSFPRLQRIPAHLTPHDDPDAGEPRGKVVPTVATSESPPDQSVVPVIRPDPCRSSIPAFYPYLESPVDLVYRPRAARISVDKYSSLPE